VEEVYVHNQIASLQESHPSPKIASLVPNRPSKAV
jgi:hypothetical protein